MTRRSRLLTMAAAGAAALALAVVPAAAASAHDYLTSSDPAAGSTVTTAIDKVTLTFNDRVLDLSGDGKGTLLTVTGAGSKHFETGCATVADTDVTAPVALGAAGKYTVTYQIVSADGHTVSNSLDFEYQPPAGATPAPGSDSTPCGATSAPTPAATSGGASTGGGAAASTAPPGSGSVVSTAQPTTASSGTDLGLVIGIAVAIVVLALIGVVIVVLTARRSRGGDGGPGGEQEAGDAERRDSEG